MKLFFSPYLPPILIISLLLYWTVFRTEKKRTLLLCATSLAILEIIHPIFGVIVLALAFFVHRLVLMMQDEKISPGKLLPIVISLGVAVIGAGKYGGDLATLLFKEADWVQRYLIMPLGISYFVFRLLQYSFDQIRGILTDRSFVRFLTFLVFTPTLPAGPLETYQGFYGKQSRSFSRQLFYSSLQRIPLGYFKKFFLVDFLILRLFDDFIHGMLHGFPVQEMHPLAPLGFVILMFVRAYLDLSAYTDLAVGFSGLFGFRIMENFNRPLLQKNLAEFWRSWHISLSSWCRNNVYFPVFGATRNPWIGLYCTMLVMGLWHYVNLNWFSWGIYHGSGLVALYYWQQFKRKRKRLKRLWKNSGVENLGYVATFFYVAVGYSFVSTHEIGHAWGLIKGCLTGPVIWAASMPITLRLHLLLALGLFLFSVYALGRLTARKNGWTSPFAYAAPVIAVCLIAATGAGAIKESRDLKASNSLSKYHRDGLLAKQKKDFTKAASLFKQELIANPGNKKCMEDLAESLLLSGKRPEAADYALSLLIDNPNKSRLHDYLDRFPASNEGAGQFDKIKTEGPLPAEGENDPEAVYNLARMHASKGDVQSAISQLNRAIDLGYSDWKRLALDEQMNEVRNSAGFIDVLNSLASQSLENCRMDTACAQLGLAFRIDSGNIDVAFNMARYSAALGYPAHSVGWLDKAVALGFKEWLVLESDPYLQKISDSGEFKAFMGKYQ